jgi:hypothetical protein
MSRKEFEAFMRGLFDSPQLALGDGRALPLNGPLFAQGDDDGRTVKGSRRRKTGDSGEPRKQAEGPQRGDDPSAPPPPSAQQPRPPAQQPRPPAGQPRPPAGLPGGGGLPGGMPAGMGGLLGGLAGGLLGGGNKPAGKPGGGRGGPNMLLIGLVVLAVVCIGGYFLLGGLFGGGDDQAADDFAGAGQALPEPGGAASGGIVQAQPTVPAPIVAPPAAGTGQDQWLIMLYQDADDKILEQDILVDLNEAERVGSTDNVDIVTQIDRFAGGYSGDGNWTETRRYHLEYDPDLGSVRSREVMNLGEVNMADGDSLVDFVTWAMAEYPADKHVLIMSDHGMGWPGGWSDSATRGQGNDRVALAGATGDQIFLMELDEALGEIRRQTGLDKFELIGMDACLMGHVEVFEALSPHTRYAVASQEVEPALGWAYTGFLSDLVARPDVSGAELGEYIVSTYIDQDQRITDDQARAEWTGRGLFGGPSPAQLSAQLSDDITLTAVNMAGMPAVMNALNDLAYVLQGEDQQLVAQARQYAQGFTSIWGKNVPASYLDMVNFVDIIDQKSRNPQVKGAIGALKTAVDTAVVAERSGPKKPGANGLSLYFPNSDLYRSGAAGASSYTEVAARFAVNSLWDDFLAFHYTGRQFEPAPQIPVAPPAAAQVSAPGAGAITAGPLALSADVVERGETITLSARIDGENIGYIKFFAGFLDEATNSLYVADTDYIDSGETVEVGGVYYPEWGEGPFTLEFEWEPIVFGIDDGVNTAVALFEPDTYGASQDDAVYTVSGVYQYADGSSFPAQMSFNNDDMLMREVYGFTGGAVAGAPREILPEPGDSFTVAEKWMDLGPDGRVVQTVNENGATVTFGNRQMAWEVLDAAPGPYVVGFLIEDLDGQVTPVFADVTVR